MRQCLSVSGILLSDEELYALEERFNDDLGFNYFWFLREVEPKPEERALVILNTFSIVENQTHVINIAVCWFSF